MPPEYLEHFLREDPSLPAPDVVLGFSDDDDYHGQEPPPELEDLLSDPDVAAVVEATDGF